MPVESRGAAKHEEELMYGNWNQAELDEKYPNRPHNRNKTLLFSDLHLTLFKRLEEQKRTPANAANKRRQTRGKVGPNGHARESVTDERRRIITRFIDRWKRDVGNDFYPAMRLIIPDRDRDRPMYGLKELAIAKLFIKAIGVDKKSEDAQDLMHWKVPGLNASSMAGDFAGRCHEKLVKRQKHHGPSELTIAQVNHMLDQLAKSRKEEEQQPIILDFYEKMNADELMWLIRIILRQIKIGSTERTILHLWHKDAENLFNISSSLLRVCWELWDSSIELEPAKQGMTLMQCFQPQLAAFSKQSIEIMIRRMKLNVDDPHFWIEEKLDGERMQLHMMEDEDIPGGRRFAFWSRKAKDYTYLYGEGLETEDSALTKHLRGVFKEGVKNIILDGEMITWDLQAQAPVLFGTLKTAAKGAQGDTQLGGMVPLFKAFDCLYLNNKDLTRYTLGDRREALAQSVNHTENVLEIHDYTVATKASEVETKLHKIVEDHGEGLVLKNPHQRYKLNERSDDWVKVKPEYMAEFGEALDCVVIGAYWGTGRRGGQLSSFMCGLRTDEARIEKGDDPQKCYSIFRVGGGFNAADYKAIREKVQHKMKKWDRKRPPRRFIEVGTDIPDMWIEPKESVVIEVKAASITSSGQYGCGETLRFPRFTRLREDKAWDQGLSWSDFKDLKSKTEQLRKEQKFKIDDKRRQTREASKAAKRQRPITVMGNDAPTQYSGQKSRIFDGLTFIVLTAAQKPLKKTSAEIKDLIKHNGGISVTASDKEDVIIIGDMKAVKVAGVIANQLHNVVKPRWLYDCVKQGELLPLEPNHLFYTAPFHEGDYEQNVDAYGDSYTRDLDVKELGNLLSSMDKQPVSKIGYEQILDRIFSDSSELGETCGNFFTRLTAFFDVDDTSLKNYFEFASGEIASSLESDDISHVIVNAGSDALSSIRQTVSSRSRPSRLVTPAWIEECWKAKTRLDEERFVPR